MASMLLRQALPMRQMGSIAGPQSAPCQLLKESDGITAISSHKCLPSVTLAAMSSPLSCNSKRWDSSVVKTPGSFNLATFQLGGESKWKNPAVDSRVKATNFFGNTRKRSSLIQLPIREVIDGRRKKRPMIVRGSQYDGVIPFNLSATEEKLSENSASTFDDLLDSSSLLEASPSVTNAAFLEQNKPARGIDQVEERIERAIFDFRFLTLFGVVGSLLGAILCFLKGCLFVSQSYKEYFVSCFGGVHTGRVILYLVEAVDVYLMGTVMLIFGMGLYELFVSSLEVPGNACAPDGATRTTVCGSNLFGLFRLRERPKWLEIRSLDELKTKLGHVIVMILLVGMFEKSKKVIVVTAMDFLCFSASILLSSGALYLLSILHSNNTTHINNTKHV